MKTEILKKEKILELLRDLEILVDSSEKDFLSKQCCTYENHITEYNRILSQLKELGLFSSLEHINFVPNNQKALMGSGITQTEIAKHGEIVTESKKLFHRVQTLIGPEIEKIDIIQVLELIFSKFHLVVRQLRDRHDKRETLDVNDEYDVQDLLHALLKIYFQDIRPEETIPSYAGGSKKMDFLLKSEKMVIEVKKTGEKLKTGEKFSDKEIGKQLLEDISTYDAHPDCNTLICFIYDPEGRIGNPVGLENDLIKKSKEGFRVIVYIFPK